MVIRYPDSYIDVARQEGHGWEAGASLVRNALSSAYDIDSTEISVTMLGSYVVLGGFVRSPLERLRAEQVAAEIVGRNYVQSRLMHR